MPRLLTHEDVASLITMETAVDAVERGFSLEGQGLADRPHRYDVANDKGWLRLMPVVVPGLGAFGFKAMNLAKGVGVRYAIWVYDLADGSLLGILDAKRITQMRTAATTAVATRLMSKDHVERVAIIGTGAEAETHLEAMYLVRPTEKTTVFSRSPENRARFIADMQPRLGCQLVDCQSLEEAVEGSDVVVLATKSSTPVLRKEHLRLGMHVNSIGSARGDQFEVDEGVLGAADVIVCDSRHHVFSEAGDAIAARERGEADADSAVDLAEVVEGRVTVRDSDDDITIFKSVGTAIQDLALATVVLTQAGDRGVGAEIDDFPTLKAF